MHITPARISDDERAEYDQALAVGGYAHAAGGMDWPMHQALDAVAIADRAIHIGEHQRPDMFHFVDPSEEQSWEAHARFRNYGYWLV